MLNKIKSGFWSDRIKKVDYTDDFIRRLRSSVIGSQMLHEGNIYLMNHAIKNMPAEGAILEIGSWAGLSTNLLLHLIKKYNRKHKLFSCDPGIYEGLHDHSGIINLNIDGGYDILRESYMEYIQQAYINSVKLFHRDNLPYAFHLTSDAFFAALRQKEVKTDLLKRTTKLDIKYSFCYIDGNHAYEHAKRDFENTDKYLLPDGFILLDDSANGSSFGSSKLIKEIKNRNDYRITACNPHYLVQKIRKK